MDALEPVSIDPSAPPCPHCDAEQGEACAASCPGKIEALS
jgi:hypothetical protein